MGQRQTAFAVTASLGAMLLAAPRPAAALALLTGAAPSSDPTAPLVAGLALLAWAVTAWLALTVALVLLSRLPGLAGRTLRRLAGRLAPAAVRRTVEAALGLTVAVGVLAPTTAVAAPVAAAVAAPVPGPSAAGAPRGDTGWDLDWPATAGPVAGPPVAGPPVAGPPVAGPPVAGPPQPATAAPTPPAAPAVERRPTAALTRPSAVRPAQAAVVVRRGDSLWAVAEAALRRSGIDRPTARQVAQAWPRWWAANREVVGDDPDLLLPGTVLRPPDAAGRP